jgi:hypothetical protein
MGVKITELQMTYQDALELFGRQVADRVFNKDDQYSSTVITNYLGRRCLLFHDPHQVDTIWMVEIPMAKQALKSGLQTDGIEMLEILFFEGHFEHHRARSQVETLIHSYARTHAQT